MYRAKRRRWKRKKAKELLHEEFTKDNYIELSRQERKNLAKEKAEKLFKEKDFNEGDIIE